MAEAYAVFASGGLHAEPSFIDEIRTPEGRVIRLNRHDPVRVMEPAQAYLISSMLRTVVQRGTARDAHSLGDDVAGKTGTSNDARDAWFVGFAGRIACAVWVGFDSPRSLGRRESGSRAALPIWLGFMEPALANQRDRQILRPPGIEVAQIDPETGLLAYEGQQNAIEEEFLEGTVPTEQALPPEMADPNNPNFLMEQTGGEEDAPEPP
jgi:penicillin-binding protein 1A